MEPESQCIVCGTGIDAKTWLCLSCERAYQLAGPFANWPAWAKAMHDEERRRRRHNKHWHEYTVLSYEEAGIESLVYGERA